MTIARMCRPSIAVCIRLLCPARQSLGDYTRGGGSVNAADALACGSLWGWRKCGKLLPLTSSLKSNSCTFLSGGMLGMELRDLQRMTVVKLREEGLKHSSIAGVYVMDKAQLMKALADVYGIDVEAATKAAREQF